MTTAKAEAKHSKTSTPGAGRPDWSLTPRGPVSAAGMGALTLVTAAAIGNATDVSTFWPVAAATVGSLGTLVRAHTHGLAPAALWYRMGCWAASGGWLAWSLATTPWTRETMLALGVGALGAVVTAPLAHRIRPRPSVAGGQHGMVRSRAVMLRRHAALAEDWQARFYRVCKARIEVTDVYSWPTGGGYTLTCLLPLQGTGGQTPTRSLITMRADALATDAQLPEGCGLEVRPGSHRGEFLLKVATVNRLHADIDYSGDTSARSVYDPMAYGEHKDGSPALAELREHTGLIVGQKGSGKTNLLHVITAETGRAVDCLVWHIDLNGGGMSQPWLHAWLEGDANRPAIDWAACTVEEAQLMVQTALAIAKDRKKSYRKLKIQADESLLPVSADLPEIVVMLDEGGEVMNPRHLPKTSKGKLRDGIEELIRIGRNEGVNVVLSSLRATQDLLSRAVVTQAAWGVGMMVSDPAELAYLFGMSQQMYRALNTDDLVTMGCAYGRDGTTGVPQPLKVARIRPSQIVAASLEISRRRPELDAAGARIAGGTYARRLERMCAAFTDLAEGETEDDRDDDGQAAETVPAVPAGRHPYDTTARRLRLVPRPAAALARVTGSASCWPDPYTLLRTSPADSGTPASRAASWPDPPRTRRLRAEQSPAAPVPQIVRRALAAFDAARTSRLHSEELAAALGILAADVDGGRGDALALAALLRPLGVAPLPNPFLRDGQRGRGYERGDLVGAAERIGRGEVEVPREVADWPAA